MSDVEDLVGKARSTLTLRFLIRFASKFGELDSYVLQSYAPNRRHRPQMGAMLEQKMSSLSQKVLFSGDIRTAAIFCANMAPI